MRDFAKSTRAGKAAMRIKAPYERGKARVATGLADAGRTAAGPLVRRAKSAGAAYRLWKLQRQLKVDASDLSEVEQKRAARFLAQHGEDGTETLRRMDSESIQRMFRKTCSVGTFRRAGGGCNQLNEEELQDYATAVDQADVGLGPFYKKIDDTDVSETAAERFVAETGAAGLRLAIKLDSDSFERLVKIDADAQQAFLRAWRAEKGEVSAGEVNIALDRYYNLGPDGRQAFRRSLTELDNRAQIELVWSFTQTKYPDLFASGLSKLRASDDGTLDEFYRFETGKSAVARRAMTVNVGLDSEITPAKAYQYSNDVRELSLNPNVDRVEEVVNIIAVPGILTNNIKGGMFEVRFTKHYIDTQGIPDGATVYMDYNLDTSIDIRKSLKEKSKVKIVREISLSEGSESDSSPKNTYESLTTDEREIYDRVFTEGTQLDTVTIKQADDKQKWIYYEVKSGSSDSAIEFKDITAKFARAKALKYLSKQGKVNVNGDQITIQKVEMRLASPLSKTRLEEIDESALDVIRESDSQNSDSNLIWTDIPWGESGKSKSLNEDQIPNRKVSHELNSDVSAELPQVFLQSRAGKNIRQEAV